MLDSLQCLFTQQVKFFMIPWTRVLLKEHFMNDGIKHNINVPYPSVWGVFGGAFRVGLSVSLDSKPKPKPKPRV